MPWKPVKSIIQYYYQGKSDKSPPHLEDEDLAQSSVQVKSEEILQPVKKEEEQVPEVKQDDEPVPSCSYDVKVRQFNLKFFNIDSFSY